MFNLVKKILKKYSEIILKLFTLTGLLIIYIFGIGLGSFIFKRLKKNNNNNHWYKFDNKFIPKDMY